MADLMFTTNITEGDNWETGTWKMLLVKGGYTPTVDLVFVDDVVPATNEIDSGVITSYARQTLTGNDKHVYLSGDTPASLVAFLCDNTDFGTLESGETVTGAIVYEFVTDDTDSLLYRFIDFGAGSDTADFDPFQITIDNVYGVAYQDF